MEKSPQENTTIRVYDTSRAFVTFMIVFVIVFALVDILVFSFIEKIERVQSLPAAAANAIHATEIARIDNRPHFDITVSAMGKQPPDQVELFVYAATENPLPTATQAMQQVSNKGDKIISLFKRAGTKEGDIITSPSVHAVYSWNDGKRVFRGYSAAIIIRGVVPLKDKNDLPKVQRLLGDIVEVGGLVNNVSFGLSAPKRDALRIELLQQADSRAKEYAQRAGKDFGIALCDGIRSVRVLSPEKLSTPSNRVSMAMAVGKSAPTPDISVPIQANSISMTITVQYRFDYCQSSKTP